MTPVAASPATAAGPTDTLKIWTSSTCTETGDTGNGPCGPDYHWEIPHKIPAGSTVEAVTQQMPHPPPYPNPCGSSPGAVSKFVKEYQQYDKTQLRVTRPDGTSYSAPALTFWETREITHFRRCNDEELGSKTGVKTGRWAIERGDGSVDCADGTKISGEWMQRLYDAGFSKKADPCDLTAVHRCEEAGPKARPFRGYRAFLWAKRHFPEMSAGDALDFARNPCDAPVVLDDIGYAGTELAGLTDQRALLTINAEDGRNWAVTSMRTVDVPEAITTQDSITHIGKAWCGTLVHLKPMLTTFVFRERLLAHLRVEQDICVAVEPRRVVGGVVIRRKVVVTNGTYDAATQRYQQPAPPLISIKDVDPLPGISITPAGPGGRGWTDCFWNSSPGSSDHGAWKCQITSLKAFNLGGGVGGPFASANSAGNMNGTFQLTAGDLSKLGVPPSVYN